MSFERFYLLFLVLAVPLYYYYRLQVTQKSVITYAPIQYHPLRFKQSYSLLLYILIECLLLTAVIVALAGPYITSKRGTVSDKGIDIAFTLDISASMQAADFPPNRLEALKKLTSDFVSRSAADRIAIVVFAKDVFNQSPLTSDHSVLHYLTDGIAYEMIDHSRSGGTAIGDALVESTDMLLRFRQRGRDQVIILITDGESQVGIDPLIAARYVAEKNIRLYIIGVGKKTPVKVYYNGKPFINQQGKHLETVLADEQLKKIADASGGKYFYAANVNVLSGIFRQLARLEQTPLEIAQVEQKHSQTHFVAAAILLLLVIWLLYAHFFIRRPFR